MDLDAMDAEARDIIANNEFLTTYAHATNLAQNIVALVKRVRELEGNVAAYSLINEQIEGKHDEIEKRGRIAGLREAASKAHNFAVELENDVARAEEVGRA